MRLGAHLLEYTWLGFARARLRGNRPRLLLGMKHALVLGVIGFLSGIAAVGGRSSSATEALLLPVALVVLAGIAGMLTGLLSPVSALTVLRYFRRHPKIRDAWMVLDDELRRPMVPNPDDLHVLLTVVPSGGDVQLQWAGGVPVYEVFRSEDPVLVIGLPTKLGEIDGTSWLDAASPARTKRTVTGVALVRYSRS